MKKHIPNIITSGNLLCGCLAISQIAEGHFVAAAALVLLAAFLDFFDGLSARLLKVTSPIGAQLDSLADVISFGVVPAYLAYGLLAEQNPDSGIKYIPFLMVAYSAYRLAKFNVDSRQSDSFIGFPTPANALLWISIPLMGWQVEYLGSFFPAHGIRDFFEQTWLIVALSIIMSYLLVAEIPLLALKFKNWKWKGNEFRFFLILTSLLLLSLLFFAAIPFILILYLVISLIENNKKNHEIQS